MKPLGIISLGLRWLAASCLMFLAADGLRADGTNIELALPASNSATNLLTRTFKVDANIFWEGIENVEGIDLRRTAPSNTASAKLLNDALRSFFTSVGVDLQVPKSIFYNETNGMLHVCATAQDLDIVEQAIQVLNIKPPKMKIQVKFAEVPADKVERLLGEFGLAETNTASPTDPLLMRRRPDYSTGTLTESQAHTLFGSLERTDSVEMFLAGEATTVSGVPVTIHVSKSSTTVTSRALVVTNAMNPNLFRTLPPEFTFELEVVSYASADGYTIQMVLIPTVSEPPGIDERIGSMGNLPWRTRTRETCASIFYDGETIAVAGLMSKTKAIATNKTAPPPDLPEKRLFVFVTPTIIDEAGKRVHSAEEMRMLRRPHMVTRR